jgi:hypothetical protein
MDEFYKSQPWYNPNFVFIHIREINNHLKIDSIWECVQTKERINLFNNYMRKLTKEESRDFKLELLIS